MNSRERVMAAIGHEEPDRVPIDLGGTRATGIVAGAYQKLREYLGLKGEPPILYDVFQHLVVLEDEVRRRFCVDTISLDNVRVAFGLDNRRLKGFRLPNGVDVRISADFNPVKDKDGALLLKNRDGIPFAKMPANGHWFDLIHFPLREASSIDDIKKYPWERGRFKDEELTAMRGQARIFHRDTNYAVIGNYGLNLLGRACFMRGWEEFMIDLVSQPKLAHFLLDSIVEFHLAEIPRYLDAVGEFIQVFVMLDDLGMQSNTFFSPEMYRSFFKSRHGKMIRAVKDRCPHLAIFLHSCGAVSSLIPDLIDIGVDILNPVQTSAQGMDPQTLKDKWGRHLTFWGGGVDTQQILPWGTPEEVRKDVVRRLDIFSRGGGFVFNPIHNIQAEVPVENIVAMFDAVREYISEKAKPRK